MIKFLFLFLFSLSTLISCGEENTTPSNSPNILISSNTFVPATLTVNAGDTVFFLNDDDNPQRILSESADNAFDDTGTFQSEIILDNGGVGSITIPDTAVAGDEFIFYSEYFEDTMTTPNGHLVVE